MLCFAKNDQADSLLPAGNSTDQAAFQQPYSSRQIIPALFVKSWSWEILSAMPHQGSRQTKGESLADQIAM